MSNRILWILIILWFIVTWYLYYNLSYIPSIKAEKLKIVKEKEELKKEKLIKKIDLVKQDKIIIEKTNADIINDIKENNENYKTFNLENNKKAYFKKTNEWLDLYYNYKKIWTFDLVYSKYLLVDSILWNNEDLYIEVWNNKYYFNSITKELKEIKLNVDVLYVKEGTNNKLIFVTKKWSFIYNIFDNSLDYFSYFNDYIYYNDWYIWIVKPNENIRLKNLWLESNNKNLIIYYNPYTKERKILFSTEIDCNKLYIKNNKVYIETKDNDLFELENI